MTVEYNIEGVSSGAPFFVSKAKVVAITKPLVEGIDTVEEFLAYCARVSNPANQTNNTTARKLLNYLIREKHWSPLEMGNIVVEIETPRDIGRQLLRHGSFKFQEFSQRYAQVTEFAMREARRQDLKNRQNSIDDLDENTKYIWEEGLKILNGSAQKLYEWALSQGIAKECARVVLPEGLTVSRMYVNGSFRSWYHYLELREGNGTQYEHVQLAQSIREAITKELGDNSLFEKEV